MLSNHPRFFFIGALSSGHDHGRQREAQKSPSLILHRILVRRTPWEGTGSEKSCSPTEGCTANESNRLTPLFLLTHSSVRNIHHTGPAEVSKAQTEYSNRRLPCTEQSTLVSLQGGEKDDRWLFRDKLKQDALLSAIPSQTWGRGGLTKQCSET